jgi:hypothetical protein
MRGKASSRALSAVLLAVFSVASACTASVPVPSPSATARAIDPTLPPSQPALTPASPIPTTSETTSPTQTPTPSPSPLPSCCAPVPTPVGGESLAESDHFWNQWADYPRGFEVFQTDSLLENFNTASLVVRGHITDIYPGEYWEVNRPVAYVTVAVSEVLKGEPISRTPGFVEVGLGTTSDEVIASQRMRLPQHDNIWFLLRDLDLSPRDPGHDTEISEFAYLPTNDLQGVMRDIDGMVKLVRPSWTNQTMGVNHFPVPFQDTRFKDLVQELREMGAATE